MTKDFKKEKEELSQNFTSVLVGKTNEFLDSCKFENNDQYCEMVLNTLAKYNVACLSHIFRSNLLDKQEMEQIFTIMFKHVSNVVQSDLKEAENQKVD